MSDPYNDEHAGQGGSYVQGEDGKRVLIARTGYQPEPVEPINPPAQTMHATKPAKPASRENKLSETKGGE